MYLFGGIGVFVWGHRHICLGAYVHFLGGIDTFNWGTDTFVWGQRHICLGV